MHHPTDRIEHTMAFVTPVVEHWLEREIAQWVHPMKDRSDDPSHHERTLLPRSYISLLQTLVTGYNSVRLYLAECDDAWTGTDVQTLNIVRIIRDFHLHLPTLILGHRHRRDSRDGRKEMFYLTTLSTHFIYSYMGLDSERGEKCFI